jgi:WD40 repeat protein
MLVINFRSRLVAASLRAIVGLMLACGGLQTGPVAHAAESAEPTLADARALQEKYQLEREQAVKAKYPPELLSKADEHARRGAEALKADKPAAAARHFRDARWQLPYLPAGLPEHVVRVLGESRLRHADRVNAIYYSPDGTRLASCSKDGTVKVWDLSNGREICTYRHHLDQPDDPTRNATNVFGVPDISFHPKGKLIASCSGNQVHIWDPETGIPGRTIFTLGKNDKPLKTIAFSPDGKSLAIGGDDGILRVVEALTGKVTYTSPPRNNGTRIEKVAYSPNGLMIVVGDSNSQVAVYAPTLPNQVPMSIPGVEQGEVMGVGFSPDNTAVFVCGRDGKARMFTGPGPDGQPGPGTSNRLREYSGHHGPVTSLAVAPAGSLLATGSDDKTVRVWEVTSGKQVRTYHGHLDKVTAVAIRPDSRQVASASFDGSIRLWDLNTTDEHRAFTEATESLWSVAYNPDGKRVATAGADKVIRVYDTATGKLEASLSGTKAPITSLVFFPDSNELAAAGGDRTVSIWDIARQKMVKEFPPHESPILSLALTDGGKLILSGSADRTVRAFARDGDKPLWVWSGRSAVCAVAAGKDGKSVAVGLADGTVVVLNISGAVPREISLQSAHVAGVAGVSYSPDGTRLATVGGDGVLHIWTVNESGALALLTSFEGQNKPGTSNNFSPLTGVAFSPDNRYIATVGADTIVHVWSIETKSEVRGLRGHSDWITSVAFSPDGRYIASVGVEKDRALRIFDLPPLEITSAGGHASSVAAVAVSPDGKTVATAGRTDQTIKLWDIATGKEIGTLIGNADHPNAITFLTNDTLVMGGDIPLGHTGRLHYWQTTPPREIKSITCGSVYTVASSQDGKKLAVWSTTTVTGGGQARNNFYEVYDATGQQLLSASDQARDVTAAVFSSDLAWTVSGDKTGQVRIFDLATKKATPQGDWSLFDNPLGDLGLSPDKKLLVAVDGKGLVKIADIAKREVLGKVEAHKSGVRTLLISPTGSTLLTIGNDKELKAWSLAPADLNQPRVIRSWALPVGVNSAAYTPDGKKIITANADGTAYVLELP